MQQRFTFYKRARLKSTKSVAIKTRKNDGTNDSYDFNSVITTVERMNEKKSV